MQPWLSSLLLSVLKMLFASFSGQIKDGLASAVRALYAKALSSANPFDDFGVAVLAFLLGISLEGVVASPAEPGVTPVKMSPETASALLKGAERSLFEQVYSTEARVAAATLSMSGGDPRNTPIDTT